MSLIVYLALLLLWGLVVGAFARLALPGPDPLTLFQTALVGVGDSFLAAIVSAALFNRFAGFVLCLAFSAMGQESPAPEPTATPPTRSVRVSFLPPPSEKRAAA